jgi:cell division protein FtsB
MDRQAFLKSRIATVVLGIALCFVVILAARVFIKKQQIDSQIAKLEDQMERIKQNNDQLTSLIKYYQTPQYQEQQAREKLNLKKDGEYVVGLPNPDELGLARADDAAQVSNAKQWFNYFFSNYD